MPVKIQMTREERRNRREEIAKAIAAGRSISEVAQSFRVGLRTVYDACREFGIDIPDQRKVSA